MIRTQVDPSSLTVRISSDGRSGLLLAIELSIIDLPRPGARRWMAEFATRLESLASGGPLGAGVSCTISWTGSSTGWVSLRMRAQDVEAARLTDHLTAAARCADEALEESRRGVERWRAWQVLTEQRYRSALTGLHLAGSPVVEHVVVEPSRELSVDSRELPEPLVCLRLAPASARVEAFREALTDQLPAAYRAREGVIRLRLSTDPAQLRGLLGRAVEQAAERASGERSDSCRFESRAASLRDDLVRCLGAVQA